MASGRKWEVKWEKAEATGGVAFAIRVVTRATSTEIVGLQDDGSLRIRLIASPAGSPEANKELVDFLAAKLDVSTDKIEIVAGERDRDKIVSVEGITPEQVETKLEAPPAG
jgi:uncharacterized protein (TIGR00251 family)